MLGRSLSLIIFLSFTTPALAAEIYRARQLAKVYKDPSVDSPIIYRLQPAEEFKVISKGKGKWLKVRFSNRVVGYVQETETLPVFAEIRDSEKRSRTTAAREIPQRHTSLPYSYEESGLRITVLKVVPAKDQHGSPFSDSRQWAVHIRYENLTNQDWEAPDLGFPIGHLVGFESLKLKTDQGNIYKLRYSGGISISGSLRPRGSVTSGEASIFDIRREEHPLELWAYRLRLGGGTLDTKGSPDFIFDLADMRDETDVDDHGEEE